MPFTAALSTTPDTHRALEEVCTQVQQQFSERPDLVLTFFSPHHLAAADLIAETLKRFNARCVLGCSGEAIVGKDG